MNNLVNLVLVWEEHSWPTAAAQVRKERAIEPHERSMRTALSIPLPRVLHQSAAADRSLNKALNSKAYIGDLLQDIENGSTKLESVKSEDLPSELQKLSAEDRAKEIEKRLAERK